MSSENTIRYCIGVRLCPHCGISREKQALSNAEAGTRNAELKEKTGSEYPISNKECPIKKLKKRKEINIDAQAKACGYLTQLPEEQLSCFLNNLRDGPGLSAEWRRG